MRGDLRAAGLAVLLAWAALALPPPAWAQCAMCKAALESSAESVGATFNHAILVMFAGPYLVMGAFGLVFFRDRLRRAARHLLWRLRGGSGPGRSL